MGATCEWERLDTPAHYRIKIQVTIWAGCLDGLRNYATKTMQVPWRSRRHVRKSLFPVHIDPEAIRGRRRRGEPAGAVSDPSGYIPLTQPLKSRCRPFWRVLGLSSPTTVAVHQGGRLIYQLGQGCAVVLEQWLVAVDGVLPAADKAHAGGEGR